MNEFVASNGMRLCYGGDGSVRWEAGTPRTRVTAALREFFLAERDAELGRWRSKEHPQYVVYARDADAYVVNEEHGGGLSRIRGTVGEDNASRVAREFFVAHPERKPWHDAKPGEVWDVFIDGERHDLTVVEEAEVGLGFFGRRLKCSIRYSGITAASRIWPEGDES